MDIIEKIEKAINDYWKEKGSNPLSVELTATQFREFTECWHKMQYVPYIRQSSIGDEFAMFKDVKLYLQRAREIKIK